MIASYQQSSLPTSEVGKRGKLINEFRKFLTSYESYLIIHQIKEYVKENSNLIIKKLTGKEVKKNAKNRQRD